MTTNIPALLVILLIGLALIGSQAPAMWRNK